jgi:hypothetical protein
VLHDIRPDSSYLILLQDDETATAFGATPLRAIDVESVAHGARM